MLMQQHQWHQFPFRHYFNCDWMSEIETRQTRQRFSSLLLPGSGEPVWIVVSVSCCQLTGGTRCAANLLQFDVLCAQRCYSAFLGWNECLFELLLPSYHLEPVGPFPSDLSHQQGIFTGYVPYFGPFSVNKNGCGWKSQQISRFWHTQTSPSGTNNQSLKSPFFRILMLGLNFSELSWRPLHAKCIELRPCDWLISCLC